ncbi:MAG: hypothetical protein DRI56_00280 [Chloroflexota bacterium]|nr:MAG: hypothetical protein DRI56_00280 [Chloroflexota bacterium]
MTTYRILIVDDHREIRSAYRANLELLEADLEVLDVPSGEEAMLEASLQKIDLLIADVRLPGLSGLELLDKVKVFNPDLKIILVTGLVDVNIRRQVADAKVDAFFLKPVEIPDLLDAVERCLGLVTGDTTSLRDTDVLTRERSSENVSDLLTGLRQKLGAFSTVLLDDHGKALARAGGLPDAVEKSQVLTTLMATFSGVNKISRFLGKSQPEDLWYFSGTKYDLFWAHVGDSHGLLVASNPISEEGDLAKAIMEVGHTGRDLIDILNTMGIARTVTSETIEKFVEDIEEDIPDIQEIVPEERGLASVLQNGKNVVTSELNAFWDTATSEEENTGAYNADALTYQQAHQLGLTPEDEE